MEIWPESPPLSRKGRMASLEGWLNPWYERGELPGHVEGLLLLYFSAWMLVYCKGEEVNHYPGDGAKFR